MTTYVCTDCGKETTSEQAMKMHRISHPETFLPGHVNWLEKQ